MAIFSLLHIIWWSTFVSFEERFTQYYHCKVTSIASDADIGPRVVFSRSYNKLMPGICCYVTTVTRFKLSRSQLSTPICGRCSSLGPFVPSMLVVKAEHSTNSVGVRSLISYRFVGFNVHWVNSVNIIALFVWPSLLTQPLWMMPHSDDNSAPSPHCVKEEHHMHSLPNKTMKRAHWKARSYFGREKKKKTKKKTCWMWNSGSPCVVCVEVIWPDGVRVKESVVTCNSSMTPVWGFKIHTPGSWIEPTADLTPV